jgi:prophage antirepressor-like protein
MTTTLAPFRSDEFELTITEHPVDGFRVVASGLARALGFRQALDLTRGLPDDEKGYELVRTPGGEQAAAYVTEAGFYRALGQRQPARITDPEVRAQVERFQSWVYGTVLPQIRRTGTYSATPELSGPELLARAVLEAQTMLAAKDEQIAELAPKADLADAYLAADGGDRLIGQAAKLLHLKEKDLRRFLIEEHLVFVRHTKCGTPQYEPYAEFAPHFSVHETIVNHTWGACSHLTLRAKPRGLDLIRRRLAKAGLIAIDGQRVSA